MQSGIPQGPWGVPSMAAPAFTPLGPSDLALGSSGQPPGYAVVGWLLWLQVAPIKAGSHQVLASMAATCSSSACTGGGSLQGQGPGRGGPAVSSGLPAEAAGHLCQTGSRQQRAATAEPCQQGAGGGVPGVGVVRQVVSELCNVTSGSQGVVGWPCHLRPACLGGKLKVGR